MRALQFLTSTIFIFSFSIHVLAVAAGPAHESKYVGQEKRAIKSLSSDDIAELERGGGWGLAKAAELNGVPGPAHLLELKREVGLSHEQTSRIEALYDQMKTQAVKLGRQLIAQEQELETRFQRDLPNPTELKAMLVRIGNTRTKLRFVHLATHLQVPEILTDDQIGTYRKLRGYNDENPCEKVPEGHDAAMWKRHNGCN